MNDCPVTLFERDIFRCMKQIKNQKRDLSLLQKRLKDNTDPDNNIMLLKKLRQMQHDICNVMDENKITINKVDNFMEKYKEKTEFVIDQDMYDSSKTYRLLSVFTDYLLRERIEDDLIQKKKMIYIESMLEVLRKQTISLDEDLLSLSIQIEYFFT